MSELTKEYLLQEYVQNKNSTSEIAEKLGCTSQTIWAHLKKHNIPRRNSAYAHHLSYGHHFKVTPSNKDYIDGLLLSDGGVYCGSKFSAFYQQACKHLAWLQRIQKDFQKFGISSKMGTRINPLNRIQGRCSPLFAYVLLALSYEELLQFRERWYPNGVKIVPRDINLESPQLLANWFMGDGCWVRRDQAIKMYTNCFSKEDVRFLQNQLLKKLNIKTAIQKALTRHILYLGKKQDTATQFLSYIEPYKVSCFDYKWS